MKKIKFILFIVICMMTISASVISKEITDEMPDISAKGYVLMDANTRRILVSKNEDSKYFPASTTKILTAIIVLENVKDLKTKITIGKDPTLVEPSSINLAQGEIIDIESLLYATLLQSANDAAEALGEYVGGSKEGFSKLMNEKAIDIGCKKSNFVNASGLHDENHYTTPKDLANILSYVVKNQEFLKISKTKSYIIENTNLHNERKLQNQIEYDNSNDDKTYYDKAICGKTGYTDEASYTYAGASKLEDKILVVSFLSDEKNNFHKYKKPIFEYGFKILKNEAVAKLTYFLNSTTAPFY